MSAPCDGACGRSTILPAGTTSAAMPALRRGRPYAPKKIRVGRALAVFEGFDTPAAL